MNHPIRDLMRDYDFSASDLAKELGVSRMTLHRQVTGKNQPSTKLAMAIGALCGIDWKRFYIACAEAYVGEYYGDYYAENE